MSDAARVFIGACTWHKPWLRLSAHSALQQEWLLAADDTEPHESSSDESVRACSDDAAEAPPALPAEAGRSVLSSLRQEVVVAAVEVLVAAKCR